MNTWTLCSLLFETSTHYETNLKTLVEGIESTPKQSLIVAAEVCITGFDYGNIESAYTFSSKALKAVQKVSAEKIIIFTLIEKKEGKIYNMLKVIHNGVLVHERAKSKLFHLGGEENYFAQGKASEIEILEIEGMRIAILICFELRFKELWKKCEGADIIALPSWWGALRKEHFLSLTKTLAIMNQCYVVASDAKNEDCSQASGIISPMGTELRNKDEVCIEVVYEAKEIQKMRRYMDVGIG